MLPKKQLLRITSPKDGEVTLDLTGKAEGRGAYICAKSECLAKAVKAKRLERAFERSIPQEVYERIDEALRGLEVKDDN